MNNFKDKFEELVKGLKVGQHAVINVIRWSEEEFVSSVKIIPHPDDAPICDHCGEKILDENHLYIGDTQLKNGYSLHLKCHAEKMNNLTEIIQNKIIEGDSKEIREKLGEEADA